MTISRTSKIITNSMNFIAISVLILLSIYKLFYASQIGLVPDEAYYWEWSRHLDLSYYDQGPGVALYIRFFTSVFGDTNFALKLAAVFATFITTVTVYYTGVSLGLKSKQLIWVLVFASLIPGFFGGSILIMHDSALLLAWSFALLFTVRYLKTKNPIYIYLLFISLGYGALSKHTMVFFALALVLWIILTPSEYPLFKNIHFYLGILLALVIISPVIYWNYKNGWENIDAIINLRSSGGANFSKVTTGIYLISQALALSPFWFIGGILLLIIGLSSRYSSLTDNNHLPKLKSFLLSSGDFPNNAWKMLFFNAAILPIFFLILSFKKDIQANWVFASYLSLILFLAKAMEENGKYAKLFRYTIFIGLIPALLLDVLSFYSVPISKLSPINLDPHYIIGYRHDGFKEIIEKVDELRQKKDPTAEIIANRYQDASIASWYLPGQPFSVSINIMQKNQYNLWNSIEKGKNYFLIHIQEKTCQKSFVFFQPYLKFMFEEMEEFPEMDIIRDGKTIKRYQVWYLKNYKKSWAVPASEFIGRKLPVSLIHNLAGTSPYQMKDPITDIGFELFTNYMDREGEVECSFIKK
ncbi:MAG: glycosyltransferase family 39 protein [Leptospiraceae bacterium]|nr:glycosyltransferase family 39 protein [Leptospiraceae bacterium]